MEGARWRPRDKKGGILSFMWFNNIYLEWNAKEQLSLSAGCQVSGFYCEYHCYMKVQVQYHECDKSNFKKSYC